MGLIRFKSKKNNAPKLQTLGHVPDCSLEKVKAPFRNDMRHVGL